MSGANWAEDAPGDVERIVANGARLLADLLTDAPTRALPTAATVLGWHARIYEGCTVPDPAYVGAFRGDPDVPTLAGYEAGVGPERPGDGLPEGVGVWSADVHAELDRFFASLHAALHELDARFPTATPVTAAADLEQVVALAAIVHGEWVRIHPFANGNGRTARLWTAFIAFRFGLPAFVQLKPRPAGVLYARAAMASMGRPPDFIGDHRETMAVFARWLRAHLEGREPI